MSEFVVLDEDTRKELVSLRKKTGIGAHAVLRAPKNLKPEGLSARVVSQILNGTYHRVHRAHLRFLQTQWRVAWNSGAYPVAFTDDFAALLKAEQIRTGMSPKALLNASEALPEGLTVAVMRSWFKRPPKRALKSHMEWVIAAYRALPDVSEVETSSPKAVTSRRKALKRPTNPPQVPRAAPYGGGRLVLTGAHIEALEAQRHRTGVEVAALMRSLPNHPERPSSATIYNWLNGTTRSAKPGAYRMVLSAWRKLPDLHMPDPTLFGVESYEVVEGKIVITDQMRSVLRDLQSSTGKGAVALLREAKRQGRDFPNGLKAHGVLQWLRGTVRSAHPAHLEFAVRVWLSCPQQSMEAVTVGPDTLAKLKESKDSGFLPSSIFKEAYDTPEGLTPAVVSNLLSGRVKKVRADYLSWIEDRCQALAMASDRRVSITPEIRRDLERLRDESGIGQTALLRDATDAPDGLTSTMISAWINGSAATARKDWLDWVMEAWEAGAEE